MLGVSFAVNGINMEKQKIVDWLDSSGGLLELKTARIFQKAGFSVSQGYHYEDLETGKIRESDLLVFGQRHCKSPKGEHFTVAVTFMVECKKSNNKQWIGFLSDDAGISSVTQVLPFQMMMSQLARASLANLMTMHFDNGQELFVLGDSAYAISTVHIGSKNGEGRNGAYLATQQVLDAALFRYRETLTADLPNRAHITIPVVVFDGDLYTVKEDDSGPDISEADEIDLMLRNRFLDEKTDAIVKIVQYQSLEAFVDRSVEFLDWLQDMGNRYLAVKE